MSTVTSNIKSKAEIVAMYGWDVVDSLSSTLLRLARPTDYIAFVDSTSPDALDSDDGIHGTSPGTPFATLNFVLSNCLQSGRTERTYILMSPWHSENVASTSPEIDQQDDPGPVTICGDYWYDPSDPYSAVDRKCAVLYASGSADAVYGLYIRGASDVHLERISFESAVGGDKTSTDPCAIYIDTEDAAGTEYDVKNISIRACVFKSYTEASPEDNDWGTVVNIKTTNQTITGVMFSYNSVAPHDGVSQADNWGRIVHLHVAGTGTIQGLQCWYNTFTGPFCYGAGIYETNSSGTVSDVDIYNNRFYGTYASAQIPFVVLGASTSGNISNNEGVCTGVTPIEDCIQADGCVKSKNFFTNAVVTAAAEIPPVVGSGDLFVVEKSLTHSAIVSGGADLTGVSSGGDILIEQAVVANGSTAMSSAGGAAVLELYTDNVAGNESFLVESEANLGANESVDRKTASLRGHKCLLESGKKVTAKATGEDFTSGGTVTVYLFCRSLAGGASLAAA